MHALRLWRDAILWSRLSTVRGRWLTGTAIALVAALIAAGCGTATPPRTTVKVVRGSVARTVAATGTLQAVAEQKLGFDQAGKLTQLLVTVGQHVEAGQVLARIDDFDAKDHLDRARGELARQQAALDRIRDGNKADAAQDDYHEAKKELGATKDQADAVDSANDDSISQTKDQLDSDRENLRAVRVQAKADQDKCNRSVTGNSHRYDGYGDSADLTTKDQKGVLAENPLNLHAPSCERAEKGKAAVASYQRRIERDQAVLAHLRRRQTIDHAEQGVAVAHAHREASAAGDAADGASSDRPHDIDEQAAIVSVALARVRSAQRDLDNTTLVAPVAGVVATISGTVGEYVGSGGGTTPLAPGSGAALPDMDSGVGGKDDTGNKATRPGGAAFITLKNVDTFQVVAAFEEADAAQIERGQKVLVSFDALPGLTRAATVTSVAPTGAQIKDVTNYYVTVVLNETDPRLKGGLTAETKVVVGGLDNVLVVPTAAVQRGGDTGVVELLQPDGTTRQVQVELGLVGDDTTQVLGGVREGQRVVIAQG